MRLKIAQFAQSRGHPDIALDVTTDDEHRFELAIIIGNLVIALAMAEKLPSAAKWKQLGDSALEQGKFALAERALKDAGDDDEESLLNLLRWTAVRTLKETFVPPTDWRYPHMGAP